MVRGLLPALGALGAIKAGQVLGDFTIGLVAAGDEIAETARSLDLSAEALQEYRHAIGSAGVTTEEFERAIKFMNNAIGTFARTGKGEAATALQELGLAAQISSGQLKGADATFTRDHRALAPGRRCSDAELVSKPTCLDEGRTETGNVNR